MGPERERGLQGSLFVGATVLSTLQECPSHNLFVPCHHLPSGDPLCRYPAACQVATCRLVNSEVSVNIMYTGWQRILKDERRSSLCLVSVTIHTPAHVRPWIRRAHWASLTDLKPHSTVPLPYDLTNAGGSAGAAGSPEGAATVLAENGGRGEEVRADRTV